MFKYRQIKFDNMNNRKNLFLIISLISILFYGCEKTGYLNDGGVHDPNVNMTTYDFLASHPYFDTLIILIDKAGLKETINGDVTFFAPTDFSIKRYLDKVTGNALGIDQFADSVRIEDIPIQTLQDSLGMYIIPGKLNRDDMSATGGVFTTLLGNEVHITLEERPNLYPYTAPSGGAAYWQTVPGIVTTFPEYVFYSRIIGDLDDPDNMPPPEEIDEEVIVQTSGIVTTNGVIHVLKNSHTLFFFKQTYFPVGG